MTVVTGGCDLGHIFTAFISWHGFENNTGFYSHDGNSDSSKQQLKTVANI
jgi:hypothetical protein